MQEVIRYWGFVLTTFPLPLMKITRFYLLSNRISCITATSVIIFLTDQLSFGYPAIKLLLIESNFLFTLMFGHWQNKLSHELPYCVNHSAIFITGMLPKMEGVTPTTREEEQTHPRFTRNSYPNLSILLLSDLGGSQWNEMLLSYIEFFSFVAAPYLGSCNESDVYQCVLYNNFMHLLYFKK